MERSSSAHARATLWLRRGMAVPDGRATCTLHPDAVPWGVAGGVLEG